MKKLVRILAALAVACVGIAFTSCAKDVTKDPDGKDVKWADPSKAYVDFTFADFDVDGDSITGDMVRVFTAGQLYQLFTDDGNPDTDLVEFGLPQNKADFEECYDVTVSFHDGKMYITRN